MSYEQSPLRAVVAHPIKRFLHSETFLMAVALAILAFSINAAIQLPKAFLHDARSSQPLSILQPVGEYNSSTDLTQTASGTSIYQNATINLQGGE